MYQRHRGPSPGVLLLAYQLLTMNELLPPVTMAAVLLQIAVYLGFIPPLHPANTYTMCVLPWRIINRLELRRLLAPVFMHADDMHLYFNMVSFMWKGRRLERRMGSRHFLLIIGTFALLTSVTMVVLAVLIEDILSFTQWNLMGQCAVGFSGVLFALKVLCTEYFPNEDAFLLGWLPVASRYVCWAELVLIQLIAPNASFIGHLAGILVGLAYTKGPLRSLLNILSWNLGIQPDYQQNTEVRSGRRRASERFSGGRTWGNSNMMAERQNQFEEFTGGFSEDQQLEQALHQSTRANPSAPPDIGC